MNKHSIKNQSLNIVSGSFDRSMALKSEMPRIFKDKIAPVMVEVFDEFTSPGSIIKISDIKIELGDFSFDDFENEITKRLENELRKALRKSISEIESKSGPANKMIPLAALKVELFEFFLLTGALPAGVDIEPGFSIRSLFDDLIATSPGALVAMFNKYKTRNVVRQRLCRQFDEPVLIKFINVIEPRNARDIVDYIADLKQAHYIKPLIQLSNREFEKQIWLIAFTHTSDEKGTTFERQNFLKNIINKLADRFSVRYGSLLKSIDQSIKSFDRSSGFKSPMPDVVSGLLTSQPALESETERVNPVSETQQALETIERYLLIGDAPGFDEFGKNKREKREYFESLRLMLEKKAGKQLRELIISAWGRLDQFKRLTAIFPKSVIARILEPAGYELFVSCGRDIKAAQEQANLFKTEASSVLDQYWDEVLAFLLVHKASGFKEVSFLKYIVTTMSTKYSAPGLAIIDHLRNAPPNALPALKSSMAREEALRLQPGAMECALFSNYDKLEVLQFWLSHGVFPWNYYNQARIENPAQLTEALLIDAPAMVAGLLNDIAYSPGLAERLFEICPEQSLIKLLYIAFIKSSVVAVPALSDFQKAVEKSSLKSANRKLYYCRLINDIVKHKTGDLDAFINGLEPLSETDLDTKGLKAPAENDAEENGLEPSFEKDADIKERDVLAENNIGPDQISDSDISRMDMNVVKSYLVYLLRHGQLPAKINLSINKLYERIAYASPIDLRMFLDFVIKDGELALRLTSFLTAPLMERTICALCLKNEGREAVRYARLLDLAMKRGSIFTTTSSYEDILRVIFTILVIENGLMPETVELMAETLRRIDCAGVTPETIEQLIEISQTGAPKLNVKWAFELEKLKAWKAQTFVPAPDSQVDVFTGSKAALRSVSDIDIKNMDLTAAKLNLLHCLKYDKMPDDIALSVNKLYKRILSSSSAHTIQLIDAVKTHRILAGRLEQTLTVSLIEETILTLGKGSGVDFARYARLLGLAIKGGVIKSQGISYEFLLRKIFSALFMGSARSKTEIKLIREILFNVSGIDVKPDVIAKLIEIEQTCESNLETGLASVFEEQDVCATSGIDKTQVSGETDRASKAVVEAEIDAGDVNSLDRLFLFLKGETIPGGMLNIDEIYELFEMAITCAPEMTVEFIRTHYKRKEIRARWIKLLPEEMLVNIAGLILPDHINFVFSCAGLIIEAWLDFLEEATAACDIKDAKWGFIMDYLARKEIEEFDRIEFVDDYLQYLCRQAYEKGLNVSESGMRERIDQIAKSKGLSSQYLYEDLFEDAGNEAFNTHEPSGNDDNAIEVRRRGARESGSQTETSPIKGKAVAVDIEKPATEKASDFAENDAVKSLSPSEKNVKTAGTEASDEQEFNEQTELMHLKGETGAGIEIDEYEEISDAPENISEDVENTVIINPEPSGNEAYPTEAERSDEQEFDDQTELTDLKGETGAEIDEYEEISDAPENISEDVENTVIISPEPSGNEAYPTEAERSDEQEFNDQTELTDLKGETCTEMEVGGYEEISEALEKVSDSLENTSIISPEASVEEAYPAEADRVDEQDFDEQTELAHVKGETGVEIEIDEYEEISKSPEDVSDYVENAGIISPEASVNEAYPTEADRVDEQDFDDQTESAHVKGETGAEIEIDEYEEISESPEDVSDYVENTAIISLEPSDNAADTTEAERFDGQEFGAQMELERIKGEAGADMEMDGDDEIFEDAENVSDDAGKVSEEGERESLIYSETFEDKTGPISGTFGKHETWAEKVFAFLKGKTGIANEMDTSEILPRLKEMLASSPGMMHEFIKAHYKDKQTRMLWVNTLPESALIRFVHLIQPAKLNIILDCSNLVIEGWTRFVGPRQKSYNRKEIKWGFVLDYLAGNNMAVFNEGAFIAAYIVYLIELSKSKGDHVSAIQIKEQMRESIKCKGIGKRLFDKLLYYEKNKRAISSFVMFNKRAGTTGYNAKAYMPIEDELNEADKKIEEQKLLAVKNAGLVLLNPFIPLFFERMELKLSLPDKETGYAATEDAIRAVHLLQYIVNEDTICQEHELALNKVLCGIRLAVPVGREIDVTDREKEAINSLIKAAISHWTIIGEGTTVEGFRESFLQRDATLEHMKDGWKLKVENKAFDMLIDQIPWGYSTVVYSWMEKPLHVEWRKS